MAKWVQINEDTVGVLIHDEETGEFVGYASWFPNATGKPDADRAHANAAIMAAAPDTLKALRSLVAFVDGLPWSVRNEMYARHNEKTGALPGSLPGPIKEARDAVERAKSTAA